MKFLKRNKFKILGISLLIIIFFGIFSKSLGVEEQDVDFKTGKVNVECLNVRCGPGVQYKKIGKIYKDDYIEVFTQLGDWYVIKTEDNLVGTVSVKYIDSVSKQEFLEEEEKNTLGEQQVSNINNQEAKNLDIDENKEEQEIILEVANIEYSNSSSLTEEEQEFLNLVNANRENNGLSKLEIDDEIQNVARLKAQDLVDNNYFSHTSSKYGDMPAMLLDFNIAYKTVGENIAGNNNLAGAVEAWMNSDNHRANILSTDYNYTGIAVVESELYGRIFVQIFVGK